MKLGSAALEDVDWSRKLHAYGRAGDTPGHLRALWSGDPERRRAATDHLWSAILHQGTPWTATGPVVRVLGGWLGDPGIDPPGLEPIRPALLRFISEVATMVRDAGPRAEIERRAAAFDLDLLLDDADEEAIWENVEAANAMLAWSVIGCAEALPAVWEGITDAMGSDRPRVRACAAMAASRMVGIPEFAAHAVKLRGRLLDLARVAVSVDERSAMVLALTDAGGDPASFLDDPWPAVRACAALAESLARDPRATREILEALEHEDSDAWFVEKPPQFGMRPRFPLVAAALRRVRSFEELCPAAVQVARITLWMCCDFEWGPLLAAAFPNGGGDPRTEAQRAFLGALVANEALWRQGFGNASTWFRKAGLPYDRDACARLLAATTM